MVKTRKAIDYAIKAHAGQTRKVSGLAYCTHPIEVYSIVKKFKESHMIDDICAAAVLHDTLEDTDMTFGDITREFGGLVASLVAEVTSDPEQVKARGKQGYINQKLLGLTSWALVIKLADMLANITDNPLPKTVLRTKAHMIHLRNNRSDLSNTHLRLIERIEEALADLYDV